MNLSEIKQKGRQLAYKPTKEEVAATIEMVENLGTSDEAKAFFASKSDRVKLSKNGLTKGLNLKIEKNRQKLLQLLPEGWTIVE